jgi:NAD(P)-dependent dehydrogenase (short-subunit alcohol dehydrogenase family)
MAGQGSGRIVNVGSISGWLDGHEVGVDHAVSKAGDAAILFPASEKAGFITGQTLRVKGGALMA